MFSLKNYGVVYTPEKLASFVAELLYNEFITSDDLDLNEVNILDPACGEGVLLAQLSKIFKNTSSITTNNFGIDVDSDIIFKNKTVFNQNNFKFISQNTILPSSKITAQSYWNHQIKNISCIIANPPWSTEKVFKKEDLDKSGYCFGIKQYDSYVLFLELSLKILKTNGLLAFIIPDSLFSGENMELRKYLLENTEIKVIARLGEKLFSNVNRSTSIIIIKKTNPKSESRTRCYRLDTEDRKKFLENNLNLTDNFYKKSHFVLQKRFLKNKNYVFDIDAYEDEENILKKIEDNAINWKKIFQFGRGIEISKSGAVVTCPNCNLTQGYTKKQLAITEKKCQFCGERITLSNSNIFNIISGKASPGFMAMYVGENLHRYILNGIKYIQPNIKGINYKNAEQYVPNKILIRKTGLGIDACIDYKSTYISQTIYFLNYIDKYHNIPLEYYLGVLNSRVIYYYYLKKYGENEWKSHPYLTKDIIFSLPLKEVTENNYNLAIAIADKVKLIQIKYDRKLDIQIEKMILSLYGITNDETASITKTINALPNLSAINQMKTKDGELNV